MKIKRVLVITFLAFFLAGFFTVGMAQAKEKNESNCTTKKESSCTVAGAVGAAAGAVVGGGAGAIVGKSPAAVRAGSAAGTYVGEKVGEYVCKNKDKILDKVQKWAQERDKKIDWSKYKNSSGK